MKRISSPRGGAEDLPTRTISYRVALLVWCAGAAGGFGSSVTAQTAEGAAVEVSSTVVERGEDFAVHQRVVTWTDATGAARFQTNQFTLLENALHYFENGEWKPSEDLIESFPDGAIARRGPNKAIFSPNLNAEAVFDIATSDEKRLRGGVRQIQLTDVTTGKSLVLATVKASAPGELVPPNQVLYRDAFDGLEADVVMVWKHNLISQNVILREQPALVEALGAAARLEVVTEFVEAPVPVLNEQVVQETGKPDVVDDVTIGFGRLTALRGTAFAVAGDKAVNLGVFAPDMDGTPVLKQWVQLADGRKFLVESVAWSDVQPLLKDLPVAQRAENSTGRAEQVALARVWPKRPEPLGERKPIQLASAPYRPKGFVVDVDLSGSQPSYTFLTGTTYYIAVSFYVGTAAFQPGCVVKYANNAWMIVYASISFPDTLQTPVFTSKDDDGFGDIISGSTHTPTYAAYPAIWFYYVPSATIVQRARIRWAKRGIEYDSNPGVCPWHIVQNSMFENCQTGLFLNFSSCGSSPVLSLINVTKCSVTTPVANYGSGTYTGSMTDSPFCTDKAFTGVNWCDIDTFGLAIGPPDTMGAVGPTSFIELINKVVVMYDKASGAAGEPKAAGEFFGGNQPDMFDPRIIYDDDCDRWIACMLDTSNRMLRIVISRNDSPTNLISEPTDPTRQWDRYAVDVRTESEIQAGWKTDFPTLGADLNGIYFVVHALDPAETTSSLRVAALKKPSSNCTSYIYQPSDIYFERSLSNNPYLWLILHPAANFDSPVVDGIVWFIGKGAPGATGAAIQYARLQWKGNPTRVEFLEAPWETANTIPTPQPYYDIDLAGPPAGATLFPAPQKPYDPTHNQKINLKGGSRLQMALVRNGYLWTCHHVGVNSGGGYSGTPSDATRAACFWYRIQIDTTQTPARLASNVGLYGKVHDSASSNPYWYYFPSLMVNGQNDMVIAFSGSRGTFNQNGTEHVGAFFTGRRNSGAMPAKPILIQAGRYYISDPAIFGDYSYTCLDPVDQSFWTIQEYAQLRGGCSSGPADNSRYGTWVTKIRTNP